MKKKARSNSTKKWLGFLGITAISLIPLYIGLHFSFLEEIENRTWDWRLKILAGSVTPDPDIKLIVIDQSSLDHFAREESIFWPWPRALYVPVIKFLERSRARGVAFDLIFSESSSYGVEDDAALTDVFKGSLPIVSAVAPQNSTAKLSAELSSRFESKSKAYPVPVSLTDSLSLQLTRDLRATFTSLVAPIPEVVAASSYFGSVSAASDSDGVFRHAGIGARVDSLQFLSLPFSLYAATTPGDLGVDTGLLDDAGRLAVRFLGPARTFRTYPISSIIKSFQKLEIGEPPLVSPDEFKNSLVFIGAEAPGLLDLRPTPLAEVFSGVEYNATVLDNLRNNRFIRKTSIALSVVISCFFLLLTAASLIFITSPYKAIAAAIGVVCLLIGASCLMATSGWWLPIVWPLLGCFGCGAVSFGFQFQLEGRQHRFIRNAFRHYVNDSIIERIVTDPSALSLGGEKRELSIFFSDIEGFTKISETIEPSKLAPLLNLFLTSMTKIIMKHGGTVDKYVGDAIVAFWNAPIADADHAFNAVSSAIECQETLHALQDEFRETFGVNVRMRVGIHTGVVSVGNFGSEERFNYTVVGDAANLASRIEGVNKVFGTSTLCSEVSQEAIGERIRFRKIGSVQVVGRLAPVWLYEPVALSVSDEAISKFHYARSLFDEGKLEEARKAFMNLPHGKVEKAYIDRIDKVLVTMGHEGKWSPIWKMDEK